MARKQGRPRAGNELLTRERILRTALRLVDAHGIDALSMRRLAAELDVDPMAIYHHLPGKEAILEGIAELAFSELRVEPCADDWREQVRAFAMAYRDLVRSHPHLTLLLIANVEAGGASVLEASERLYQALEKSGLPRELIVPAAGVIIDYVHGFALAEGLALRDGATGGKKDLAVLLERYPSLNLPAMRRAMRSPSAAQAPADLESGINLILAGISAMIPRTSEGSPG